MTTPVGRQVRVQGMVQGVGYRPFLYALAQRHGLTGEARNTAQGVVARVFGPARDVDAFVAALRVEAPPLARVSCVQARPIPAEEHAHFRILPSDAQGAPAVAVTPDAAICDACRRELLDPQDRRYRYPLLNCTQCGPRYSILLTVPYDRPNITMRAFPMCGACRAEYEDPTDRRHHAQPTCCPACGPRVRLLGGEGEPLDGDPVRGAARLLREGRILAVKGLGGFHLACDATRPPVVARLRARKHREDKPLAVMVPDADAAAALVHLPDYGRALLTGPQAPILVAPERAASPVAEEVAPGTDTLGVMVAYTPLHVLLFEELGDVPLVMTSGNLSEEPICIRNREALERLSGVADAFLVHDRPIHLRVDDSVLLATDPGPTLLRRARGYVPAGLEAGLDADGILGFGPLLKNTLALGRGTTVFPGQHVGDLDNVRALEMFDEVRAHLAEVLGVAPTLAACDLHPDYPTTRMAAQSGLPVVRVQHHHAHLAALLAETGDYASALGIAFDGAGYGPDGTVWGGEALVFDALGYERVCHLEHVALPGGDRAAREPWRMALAYLVREGLDWTRWVAHPRADSVARLLAGPLPQVQTSSMGRLFDAVAALCGLCDENTFEAKAPMRLEAAATDAPDAYPFALDGPVVRTGGVIRGVAEDLARGAPVGAVAGRFHNTLADLVVDIARRVRAERGLARVLLSGGCFVNRRLLAATHARLREAGFRVAAHTLLPPGDGAVSVGQVVHAAARRSRERGPG